jgi:hypothetical protein
MARIHTDRSDDSASPPCDSDVEQGAEIVRTEGEKKQQWPAKAVAATCKYLSEGVRTLAQAYSTYDKRDIQ